MKAIKRTRRYYLHSKLKNVVNIESKKRQININPDGLDGLDEKIKSYVLELQSYGYNIQTYIE